MNIINSIFDGLFGYEKLMLLCGFILFVFALLAITLMIVQRRDFKAAMLLIVVAIVLMGFPGIQAVKFSQGMVEIDRIRAQSTAVTNPEQKQQDQQLLGDLQARAGDNPQLLARVSDGYRAIGDVSRAYELANSVLQKMPSAEVQKTLIPVLTAKLNQLEQQTPAAPSPTQASPVPAAVSAHAPDVASVSHEPTGSAAPPAPAPAEPSAAAAVARSPLVTGAVRGEITTVAKQLQGVAAPLPANSRIALASAYVKLGDRQQARENLVQARTLNPNLKLSAGLEKALRPATEPTH